MQVIIDQIMPILASLLAAASTAFLAWLGVWLRARFKVQQDKDHADSLNIAVTNGAGGVLNVLGETALTSVVLPTMPAVKAAVEYVQKLNPGDVEYFKLTPAAIAEKVVNAVGKLTAPALVTAVAKR